MSEIDVVENELYGKKILSKKDAEKYYQQYKAIFRDRNKKPDFTDPYKLGVFLNKAFTELLGVSPYLPYRKNIKIEGKWKTKTSYLLNTNTDSYKYHKILRSMRLCKAKSNYRKVLGQLENKIGMEIIVKTPPIE